MENTLILERIVYVLKKDSTSMFVKKNRKFITDTKSYIGGQSHKKGVYRGLTFEEEDFYLPQLLGVDPNVPEWQRLKNDFWKATNRNVPEEGIDLQIGFKYDYNKANNTEYGREIIKTHAIKDVKGLSEFIERETSKIDFDEKTHALIYTGIVPENKKLYFGNPIVVEDYVLWRYLLGYRDCAVREEFVHNAPHIRFYLKDDTIIKQDEANAYNIRKTARAKFYQVVSDKQKSIDILVVSKMYKKDFTDNDVEMALESLMEQSHSQFIKLVDDKTISEKADISRMISFGILRQAPNSTAIFDVEGGVIGASLNDAVEWFADPNFAVKANQYRNSLKAYLKSNTKTVDESLKIDDKKNSSKDPKDAKK